MNIRTVTYFLDPAFPVSTKRLTAAGRAVAAIKSALESAGYTVQTTRLAAPPFPKILQGDAGKVVQFARDLEAECLANGIGYAAIGPARPQDAPAFFDAIPDAIGATENVFASAIVADRARGISLSAVRRAAEIIHRCARVAPDGFGNLRFAALANVPPGAPFLPAAYHGGGAPSFAIGVESADLAVSAFAGADSLADARARLVRAVETEARRVAKIARRFDVAGKLRFGGIDFSLAPFPEAARSVGTALERLTGGRVGEGGTLAAAAFVTDALHRAQFPATGFSGLFLPVFEDTVLAQRAAEGLLTVNDLLLYSSVCGTGLDTVPLPGDVTSGELAAILLDVAALARRLDKPLTARLMPIPGKRAGDPVTFDFLFFAPSCVLASRAQGLLGEFFGWDEAFDLRRFGVPPEKRSRAGGS